MLFWKTKCLCYSQNLNYKTMLHIRLFFLIFSTFALFSCVSNKKYLALQKNYDAKEVELKEARATIASLQHQIDELQAEKKSLTQDLRKLTSASKNTKDEQVAALEKKIKDLEAKIAFLEKNQKNNNQNTNTKTDTKSKKNNKNAY